MLIVNDVEAIMVAFETMIRDNIVVPPPFDTMGLVTRIWQPWDALAKIQQPALVITEPSEERTNRRGEQFSLKLDVKLVLYVTVDPADINYPPNTRVNRFIEAVLTAMLPRDGHSFVVNAQTLNGLVSNVFADGRILKDSGVIDNQGSALIPVTVLIS